jgi:flagellum-specific peptidoglycan hydrolase FlgJ/LysM repeat protein
VLRSLCTTAVLQARLLPLLLTESLHPGVRRAVRPMAVPMPSPRAIPMAVPLAEPGPSRTSQMVALGFLVLAAASLWRQDNVVAVTRAALDGLIDRQVMALDLDAADIPAMDPSLAKILDPRSRLPVGAATARVRRVAVQPFEYEVRAGESAQEIAARFGTDVSALLWNNGLDGPDQVEAGARLTILPVRGVLHLVKAGDTLKELAERYGARLEDIVAVNALDDPNHIEVGQVIVVAGGNVPMPTTITEPETAPVALPDPATMASATLAQAQPAPLAPAVEEDLPPPSGAAAWQRDFIMAVAPGARESQRRTGVPASVTLAQAILESDWGRSKLTREANNLFGIKAQSGPGSAGVYEINTWEVYGGQNATVLAGFRAYTTLADSIVDHGRWFHDNSRYWGALAVKEDPRAFAYAINAAGYATDPAYAPKLIGLMDKFNLYAYDVAPGQ